MNKRAGLIMSLVGVCCLVFLFAIAFFTQPENCEKDQQSDIQTEEIVCIEDNNTFDQHSQFYDSDEYEVTELVCSSMELSESGGVVSCATTRTISVRRFENA